MGDWARCEREKDGGSAVINYGEPHPLLFPLFLGGLAACMGFYGFVCLELELRGVEERM